MSKVLECKLSETKAVDLSDVQIEDLPFSMTAVFKAHVVAVSSGDRVRVLKDRSDQPGMISRADFAARVKVSA